MKNIFQYVIAFFILFGVNLKGYTQESSILEYLQVTGDFAFIYSGKLETGYNPYLYENAPYYISSEYVDGKIYFDGNFYPKQSIRLDLYRDNLIVLLPEKSYSKIVNPEKIDSVFIHDKKFVYFNRSIRGLKDGFYLILHQGENLMLTGKSTYKISRSLSTNQNSFSYRVDYNIFKDNKLYKVTGVQTFYKLFPQYKDRIKIVVKENSLSFKKDKETALSILAAYCEKWIIEETEP